MRRIIISEKDLTTVTSLVDASDVVYVPGFSSAETSDAFYHIPVLCKTASEFKSIFGSTPPTFEITNEEGTRKEGDEGKYAYPLHNVGTGVPGFPIEAIPESAMAADPEGEIPTYYVWNELSTDSIDPGYAYALELLSNGIPVLFDRLNKERDNIYSYDAESGDEHLGIHPLTMYSQFSRIFDVSWSGQYLVDRDYDFKYITTGGYPVFEYDNNSIVNKMLSLAECIVSGSSVSDGRGDCIAIIDHTNSDTRPLIGTGSVYGKVKALLNSSYGAMFTPWCDFSLVSGLNMGYGSNFFPASLGYLIALGQSIKINPNWLPIAGTSRGNISGVKSLNTTQKLTNAIAELMQIELGSDVEGVSINPITYISGHGYCIWGNRTLLKHTQNMTGVALSFLNIRNIASDIKKLAYKSAQQLMFEPNTDVLWTTFKSKLTPKLDQMRTGAGIASYKIVKTSNESDRVKLSAQIIIVPIYAVEKFEIGITLTDTDLVVA